MPLGSLKIWPAVVPDRNWAEFDVAVSVIVLLDTVVAVGVDTMPE